MFAKSDEILEALQVVIKVRKIHSWESLKSDKNFFGKRTVTSRLHMDYPNKMSCIFHLALAKRPKASIEMRW